MELLNRITITAVEEITTVASPHGRCFSMKNRPTYGLSFCNSGQITYRHRGKEYISDHNHAIILPKNESYTLFSDKTGEFPLINFQCDGLDTDTFLCYRLENPESYLTDFERMNRLFLFERNRARVMSIFYDLIARMVAEEIKPKSPLAAAVAYLEQHYNDPLLTNTRLAQIIGISEVYFRRLFIRQYGATPKQYISEIRIRKAKQMLTSHTDSITCVSEQCGFTNVYYFCRAFKGHTGLTPTEYRKQTEKDGL